MLISFILWDDKLRKSVAVTFSYGLIPLPDLDSDTDSCIMWDIGKGSESESESVETCYVAIGFGI